MRDRNGSRQEASATARDWLARRPLFLDTETTGLGPQAEIVEVALLDTDGTPLIDSLVRPTQPIPLGAQRIHGIDDEDVASAPPWPDLWPQIVSKTKDRPLSIYNAEFDMRLMLQSLRARGQESSRRPQALCIMQLYARYRGDWSSRHGSYRWYSLDQARYQLGLTEPNTHRALADAVLARAVLRAMAFSTD